MEEYEIHKIIRSGIILSLSLNFVGLLLTRGYEKKSYETLEEFLRALIHFDGLALIYLGIFALILTPIASLIYVSIAFLRKRDYISTFLTLLVLAGIIMGVLVRLLVL